MMAKALENSAAPPKPCSARKMISCVIPEPMSGNGPNSPESPQSIEPTKKSDTPKVKIGLRPYISDNLP